MVQEQTRWLWRLHQGTYSVFLWDDDSKQKKTDHSPTCCIPLMLVNEHDDKFAFFLSSYNERFIDNEHEEKGNNETIYGNIGVDQQSTTTTPSHSLNIFIKEFTVKSTIDEKKVICIVVDKFNTTTGLQRYKIFPLNKQGPGAHRSRTCKYISYG